MLQGCTAHSIVEFAGVQLFGYNTKNAAVTAAFLGRVSVIGREAHRLHAYDCNSVYHDGAGDPNDGGDDASGCGASHGDPNDHPYR